MASSHDYMPRFEWRFLGPRFWPVWLVVGLLGLFLYLPVFMRNGLAKFIADRFLSRHQKRRQIVDTNLKLCFPHKSEAERAGMVQRYYFFAARALLDLPLLWFASRRHLAKKLRMVDSHHLLQYGPQQRVIMLTCHGLALEFGALAITQHVATVGLVKPARNPVFDWLITKGRTRFHCHLFERETGIRAIVNAIRNGDRFYYLPDEDLGGSQPTIFVPFFGVPTATLTSLGRMSRMCDAAVVPCFTYLDEKSDQYIVQFFPPEDEFSGKDEQADTERMNHILEMMINKAPEQYMWSLRLFQTRPEGVASPYT